MPYAPSTGSSSPADEVTGSTIRAAYDPAECRRGKKLASGKKYRLVLRRKSSVEPSDAWDLEWDDEVCYEARVTSPSVGRPGSADDGAAPDTAGGSEDGEGESDADWELAGFVDPNTDFGDLD